MTTPTSAPARPTPPFLFLFLDLPFGAAVGYAMIAMPFWLRQGGVSLGDVGAISAAAFAPHGFKLLWIPLLDLGSYRKVWYLAMAAGTASLLVAASLVPDPVKNLHLYTILVTLAQATATTGHAANNALMAITTRFEDKGKAAGFSMASNLGGTGLLGALALVVSEHVSPRAGGIVLAAIVLASAAVALRIVEPRRVDAAVAAAGSVLRAFGRHLVAMGKDLWGTVKSREGITGLVICVAPVGLGALTNIFSGMAADFSASARVVEVVNGVGGGVTGAAGALVGGWPADRMSRRLAYGVAGFYLLDRHYSVNFGFWAAVRQTVVMFTQFYDPGLTPVTRFGQFFADSIYVVGAVTFSYAGLMLLRPVFFRYPATAAERERARSIVEEFGHSSLARYLLFDDKRYYFTQGGTVIGYALMGRTAIVLGDPVGPPADLPAAIEPICESRPRYFAPLRLAIFIASTGVNPASTSNSTSRRSPNPATTPPFPVGSSPARRSPPALTNARSKSIDLRTSVA